MLNIKREKVDTSIEKRIITGMITNTEFISRIAPLVSENMFSEYSQTISSWCIDYYNKYNEAPKKQIESIFEEKRCELEVDIEKNISTYLQSLSNNYRVSEKINVEYLADKAEEFFKDKLVNNFAKSISRKLRAGDLSDIEQDISKFQKVSTDTISFFQPLKEIGDFKEDGGEDVVLKKKDKVGKFLGEMRRGWLVSFQAPEKGGKSFILNEMLFRSLMENRKVLFISLEMNNREIQERIYNRLTGKAYKVINPITYPVFDCVLNQMGECDKSFKQNRTHIMSGEEILSFPLPLSKQEYQPCTLCRGSRSFVPAVWYNQAIIPPLSNKVNEDKIKRFNTLYPDSELVTKSFPAFKATPDDIMKYINALENNIGFMPDVFILDYVDILDNTEASFSERGRIDWVWKKMKQMAEEKHILIITAEQSKKLLGKETQTADDNSEDKRKNAHINAKFSINCTLEENEQGVRRIGQLLHRHRKVSAKQLMCLGCLEVSAPIIDCEEIFYINKKKEDSWKK